MVGEKDLLHDVFAKVEFAPVCPLQFQKRHGRCLVHENVGSLQHRVIVRPALVVWSILGRILQMCSL